MSTLGRKISSDNNDISRYILDSKIETECLYS